MKDYQAARRKLESRRLAYDSVLSKVQKMRKEDVRTEEELRSARAKYEETSEDVHNRMTAIQEAEVYIIILHHLFSFPTVMLTLLKGRQTC